MTKKRLSTDDVPEKCKRLKNEQDSNKKVPPSTMVTIDSGTILKPKLVIEEPNNDQFKFKQNSNNRYVKALIFIRIFNRRKIDLVYINISSILLTKQKRKQFFKLDEQHRRGF
jgi:hypothetical protein